MDHFPLPKDARPIRVPYRAKPYSTGDGGFSGYPARCGWTTEHLNSEDQFGGRLPVEVEAFFQSWLYFGVLVEIFSIAGVSAKTNEFIDSSQRFVSTSNLPSKLRKWNRAHSKASKSEKIEWIKLATGILNELTLTLLRYGDADAGHGSDGLRCPVSDEVFLSMLALCYTVKNALHLEELPQLPASALLRRRIRAAGWCPMDVARALKDMDVDGHYYMAAYPKPLGLPSHQECTEISCSAAYVDEDNYVTKHTYECCRSPTSRDNDEHIEIDVSSVVRILKNGGFPVVYWDTSEDRICVDEFNADAERKPVFVAISHVWADGMGNPHKNSLPRCQLVRLQRLVNNLAADIGCCQFPIRFWIDTLCIPVAKHLKEYRVLSILRMKSIYWSSAAVLVVESLLGGVHWADTEYEKSLRIYFSTWNKRLWTFQEGFLAPKLMLQFADKAISYRENINFSDEKDKSLKRGHCVTFPYKATTSVMSEFVVLRDFITGGLFGEDDYQALPIIVSRIKHRTTSKLSDQAICICAIMGKDSDFLFKAKQDEHGVELQGEALEESRMEAFLRMIGRFYPRLIFNTWPRLKNYGFRWGPRSLLGIPADALLPDVEGEAAVLTENRGLLVKFSGIMVDQPIRFQDLTRITYHLPQHSGQSVQLKLEIIPNQNLLSGLGSDTDGNRNDHFAVIFSYPLQDLARDPSSAAKTNFHILPRQRVVIGTVRDSGRNSGLVEPIQIEHCCVANAVVLNPSALAKGQSDRPLDTSLLAALDLSSPPPSDTTGVDLGCLVARQSTAAGKLGCGVKSGGKSTIAGKEQSVDGEERTEEDVNQVKCKWLGDHAQWLII